jgi:hemerythrin-like domain-containing protein
MLAADLLMKEHRLIERIIPLLTKEVVRLRKGRPEPFDVAHGPEPVEGLVEGRLSKGGEVNAELIVSVVSFFRTYADRCHHGKEEDILFRALASKPMSDEHRRTMDRLTEEHVLARALVGRLMLDQDRCVKGDKAAMAAMRQDIQELADLYPKHIGLEEKSFFLPCMDYFSAIEQAEMLRAFTEFDAKIVHEQYRTMIEDLEAAQKAKTRKGRTRK